MVIFLLQIRVNSCIIHVAFAGVMELVDVVDSKSTAGDSVPVRVRSPAPRGRKVHFATTFFYTHGEKNSSARSLAPPFQITTTCAGFDLGLGMCAGKQRHLYCCDVPARCKRHVACSGFFILKIAACPSACSFLPAGSRPPGPAGGLWLLKEESTHV